MHKAWLQHNDVVDDIRDCSSPPCWMHEVDPGYFGFWSRVGVAGFLTSLLERERIGARAFADIGHAADLGIADRILESELEQGAICILLQQAMAKRGAAVAPPRKRPAGGSRARPGLAQAVASAMSNQIALVHAIEQAAPNISDPELSAHLVKLLEIHRKQLEQLKTLLA